MAYCSYNDLVLAFGENEVVNMLDRDRDGSEDDGVADDGIAFASDLIDGYLRERYSLPISSVPRNLVGVACDIARYRYYQDQPTDLVVMRYQAALDWLRDVSKGIVNIEIIDEPISNFIASSTPEQVFTRLVW